MSTVQQCSPSFVTFREEGLVTLRAEGSKRSFNMLAYTGANAVARVWGRLLFDLSGVQFKKVTPILRDHDYSKVLGQSSEVTLTSAGMRIQGHLLLETEAAREVARLSDAGYGWQASVGMEITEYESLAEGQSAQVNGRRFEGPLYIARKSVLRESSFVAVGADIDTSAEVLSFAGGKAAVVEADFITQAQEIASKRNLSLADAMIALNREQPGLRERCEERANASRHCPPSRMRLTVNWY